MNLKALISSAALLLTLSPLPFASAQSDTTVYVFETVDSFEMESASTAKITGILQGEATPRTITAYDQYGSYDNYQRARICERFALISMSKPGQYYFEVKSGTRSLGCKLTRR
ncbi:hypothetical protein JQX13_09830 [Archangium violaceum]|uniref:hypothetical protein n=1 Tax=Archangium violaceum TaxID=83451 RepID=UPI00193BE711|nr:hypothetical protein [Archangium violaceum]QRK10356.1 hypothetical protein JQX13_09830 [Archangium violaceum]